MNGHLWDRAPFVAEYIQPKVINLATPTAGKGYCRSPAQAGCLHRSVRARAEPCPGCPSALGLAAMVGTLVAALWRIPLNLLDEWRQAAGEIAIPPCSFPSLCRVWSLWCDPLGEGKQAKSSHEVWHLQPGWGEEDTGTSQRSLTLQDFQQNLSVSRVVKVTHQTEVLAPLSHAGYRALEHYWFVECFFALELISPPVPLPLICSWLGYAFSGGMFPTSSVNFFGSCVLLVCRYAWLLLISITISGVFCTNLVYERARQGKSKRGQVSSINPELDLQSQRPAVLLLINKTQIFTLLQQFPQVHYSVAKSLWVMKDSFCIWELLYMQCKFPVL